MQILISEAKVCTSLYKQLKKCAWKSRKLKSLLFDHPDDIHATEMKTKLQTKYIDQQLYGISRKRFA